MRYEEGGGIWPHIDVADNEITLTLQLEVITPQLLGMLCASFICLMSVSADSRGRFLATARAPEQRHHRFCAHGRQRRSALLGEQARPLARQDASPLHRDADDIRLEAL